MPLSDPAPTIDSCSGIMWTSPAPRSTRSHPMSPDSQRLEVELIRARLTAWLEEQPDFHQMLGFTVGQWLDRALEVLDLDQRTLAGLLAERRSAQALRSVMLENIFSLERDGESLFDLFTESCGAAESGLRRRYLRRLACSLPRLWQVVAIEPGAQLRVLAWPDGEVVTVVDRSVSRKVRENGFLVARVIDMPAGPMFGEGLIPFPGIDFAGRPSPLGAVHQLLNHHAIVSLAPAGAEGIGTQGGIGGRGAGNRSGERGGREGRQGGPQTDRQGDRQTDRQSGRPERSRDGASRLPGNEWERVLDRVRKLFAMAQEVEASPHEAEIALRRCQSLMKKYGITEADLETSAFGSVELPTKRTLPMHLKYLAAAVARLHDVLFVTGHGGFAEFRGFEVDAHVARLTLDYLLDAVERSLTARKRDGNFPAGRSAAYDYRVGFALEVDQRVSALVAERDRAEQQSAGNGKALAVRKREIVERECARDLTTSSFRGRAARDAAARAAGHDDGARVSLDRQVDDTSTRPALPRPRT